MHYRELKASLNADYTFITGHCCDHDQLPNLAGDENSELLRLGDELAAKIYEAKSMLGTIPDALIMAYSSKLMEAILQGVADSGIDIEDSNLLAALEQNVYQFGAAKSFTQMKSLTQALLDDQGKLRTWTQFRNEALKINNEQVMQWLQAEYQNAIGCAQMASRWIDITSRAKNLPMIRYVTAGDDRVRPAHRAMNGITLPVNHPFWLSYFPPNGWGCRCDIQQGNWEATAETDLYYPTDTEVPGIFRFNPGATRMAFPASHPYFIGVPHDILEQGNQLYKQNKAA